MTLARQMAERRAGDRGAGGLEEPGALGTDAMRVMAGIEAAMSPDGVLVLMDLGSALMSAEMAVELLGPDTARTGAFDGGAAGRGRRGRRRGRRAWGLIG